MCFTTRNYGGGREVANKCGLHLYSQTLRYICVPNVPKRIRMQCCDWLNRNHQPPLPHRDWLHPT